MEVLGRFLFMSLKGFGSNKVMRIGQANIDFDALTIHSLEGQFNMESKVMRVLEVLVENAGQVLTRSDLIEAVWGVEYGGDERLSRAISLLRKALGDSRSKAEYIETIPRRGYRFIAEVGTTAVVEPPEIVVSSQTINEASETAADPDIRAKNTTPQVEAHASPKRKKPLVVLASCILILAFATLLFPRFNSSLTQNSPSAQMKQAFENLNYFSQDSVILESERIFTEILADNPDNAAARSGLSLALIRRYAVNDKDPALLRRAKSSAEAALRNDDHLGLANIALGWAKEHSGDLDGAMNAYDRAGVLDPDNIFLLEGLARAQNKLGHSEQAIETLNKGMLLYPDAPIFFQYSGDSLIFRNKYEQAETMFRQVIAVSKNSPDGYAALAHAMHLQDRTSEAIQVLQDGLAIDKSALLYNNLGTYLFFQGQYEMSANAFEKTLEFGGDTHDYLYWANLADAYRFVPNRRKESIEAYDQAINLLRAELENNLDNPRLNSRLALYLVKRGNLDEARRIIEQIDLSSNQPSSMYYRALVTYELLSERENALLMLKKALSTGYPLIEIKNDPELKNLRQDKVYHLILSKEGTNNDSIK